MLADIYDAVSHSKSVPVGTLGSERDFITILKQSIIDPTEICSEGNYLVSPIVIGSLSETPINYALLDESTSRQFRFYQQHPAFLLTDCIAEVMESTKEIKGAVKVSIPIISKGHWVYVCLNIQNGELFQADLKDSLYFDQQVKLWITNAIRAHAPYANVRPQNLGVQRVLGTCMDWVMKFCLEDMAVSNRISQAKNEALRRNTIVKVMEDKLDEKSLSIASRDVIDAASHTNKKEKSLTNADNVSPKTKDTETSCFPIPANVANLLALFRMTYTEGSSKSTHENNNESLASSVIPEEKAADNDADKIVEEFTFI